MSQSDPEPELTLEESEILERLEDAEDAVEHCHHALVHNPFTWKA
jgi:hypothetical protein